jgi:hypothetical protein
MAKTEAFACATLQVEYALTEDKRLRGNLRDPSAIEAQITALQVCLARKAESRLWCPSTPAFSSCRLPGPPVVI